MKGETENHHVNVKKINENQTQAAEHIMHRPVALITIKCNTALTRLTNQEIRSRWNYTAG
jgi:glutamate racemase